MLPTFPFQTRFVFLLIFSMVVGISPSFAQEEKPTPECDGSFKGGKKPKPKEIERVLEQHVRWVNSYPMTKREGERANFCGADLAKANLLEANLYGANLEKAVLYKANLQEADLQGANLRGAHLQEANLQGANLIEANLQGAGLFKANLQEAQLYKANLEKAHLFKANLRGVLLQEANLQGAELFKATLQGARLRGANLNGAKISKVDLNGVAFSLEPGGIPLIPSFATVKNLDKLLYVDPPHSLVEIRNGLKEAGMREKERILTYVIKHGAMETAWRRGGLLEKVEAFFSWLLFEVTTKWGMEPGRPLGFLGWLMVALAPIYSVVATRKKGKGRIWKVLDPARLDKPNDEIDSFPLSVGFVKALWIGLYFSLLSAFRIGWREINVGNWISRLQPQEYTLQATGWVRVVCGFQSLLSVFFIALWALTYFGRPFE